MLKCLVHCLRQNLNTLIIMLITCFPRIKCQMRRKRKCWKTRDIRKETGSVGE